MKIALVTFLFGVEHGGGAGLAVQMLAEALVKRGIRVVVITTHSKNNLSVEQKGGLTIFRFLPKNLYWVGEKDSQPSWKKVVWQLLDIWNPFVFRTVGHILRQEQPDLIHVQKLRGLSPAVWGAARSAGIGPIIQTCQDYELMSPQGILIGRIGTWAHQRSWFLRPYQRLRAKMAQILAAATAPSHYVLDTLGQAGFFHTVSKSVVPNSHGLTKAQLLQHQAAYRLENIRDQKVKLLYLGRLEEEKGITVLCRAFVREAAECPQLHLDIAGWGGLAERLMRQYEHHPQITFHGAVFGQDKTYLLQSSDIMVVPSLCPEAFGIVIVEAFAAGVPVLAARSGGIPELIDEGKTGFLVPPGDVEALAMAINRVATNPDEVRQMAPACFASGQLYTIERMTQGYLSVYEQVSGIDFGTV